MSEIETPERIEVWGDINGHPEQLASFSARRDVWFRAPGSVVGSPLTEPRTLETLVNHVRRAQGLSAMVPAEEAFACECGCEAFDALPSGLSRCFECKARWAFRETTDGHPGEWVKVIP